MRSDRVAPNRLATKGLAMGGTRPSIVVGVDGSASASKAARWAGAVAGRLGASLHLVHVMRSVDEALLEIATSRQADAGAYPREVSQAVLDRVAQAVRADTPGLAISRTLSRRPLEEVLTERSRDAWMIVLACADVSPSEAFLVGSTTLSIAAHSACPVVAWRGAAVSPNRQAIVVGVDDDQHSRAALETAFRLADLLHVELRAVHAISAQRPHGKPDIPGTIDWLALEGEARRQLMDIAAPVADRWPEVDVTYLVDGGRPSRLILNSAADAQLIVVGPRGRGNVASALLGSTSLSLLHHSPGPVVLCPASATLAESPLGGEQYGNGADVEAR
ncbi:MAG TPA: universal stress protein [Mycobacterium sp.]|nr:universal stress protein [Mycobacterium sp.]